MKSINKRAIVMVEALVAHSHNVPKALQEWDVNQLSHGMQLWKQGRSLGDRSQFSYGKDRTEG